MTSTSPRRIILHPPPSIAEMAPGIAGVYWRMRDTSWDLFPPSLTPHPQSSILSLVQLPLLPGLSVLDPAGPVGKLWRATLESVSSMPGRGAILWGTESEGGRETVCLVVEWDSPAYWRDFQTSMGVSLMFGVLGVNPSNRCVRHALPELPPRLEV